MNTDEKFQKIVGMREKAKTKYKELMNLKKLSKAMNMKTTSARAYHQATWSTRSDIKLQLKDASIKSWTCRDDKSQDGLDQPGF